MPLKSDFGKFRAEVKADVKTFQNGANKLVQKIVLTGHSMLVNASPVDTGRYKASHFFSANNPMKSSAKERDFEKKNESGARASIDKQEAKINRTRFDPFVTKSYYIVNNLQYAERLEAGHSEQARQGIYIPTGQRIEKIARQKIQQFNRIVERKMRNGR